MLEISLDYPDISQSELRDFGMDYDWKIDQRTDSEDLSQSTYVAETSPDYGVFSLREPLISFF